MSREKISVVGKGQSAHDVLGGDADSEVMEQLPCHRLERIDAGPMRVCARMQLDVCVVGPMPKWAARTTKRRGRPSVVGVLRSLGMGANDARLLAYDVVHGCVLVALRGSSKYDIERANRQFAMAGALCKGRAQ